jgi:hypothetical protein
MKITWKYIVFLLPLLLLGSCSADVPSPTNFAPENSAPTREGLFLVSWESSVTPVPLQTIHEWTLTVTDPEGNPVEEANILIDGDMPEHMHGLPTQPEVTDELGDGRYRVEGMKFSMPGFWNITVFVQAGGRYDQATFELTLEIP